MIRSEWDEAGQGRTGAARAAAGTVGGAAQGASPRRPRWRAARRQPAQAEAGQPSGAAHRAGAGRRSAALQGSGDRRRGRRERVSRLRLVRVVPQRTYFQYLILSRNTCRPRRARQRARRPPRLHPHALLARAHRPGAAGLARAHPSIDRAARLRHRDRRRARPCGPPQRRPHRRRPLLPGGGGGATQGRAAKGRRALAAALVAPHPPPRDGRAPDQRGARAGAAEPRLPGHRHRADRLGALAQERAHPRPPRPPRAPRRAQRARPAPRHHRGAAQVDPGAVPVRLEERTGPQLRYRVERAGGIPLREMIRRAARHGLALAVGLAAIPVSAGLGLAALAAEGVSRLRPRRRPEPAPARRGPRLATIQILNYQGRELLERNLPSVIAAVPAPHEILVVDNGSSDGSVEMLREKFPQVTIVALDRNYFFARGNNAGVPHARHDIVVLLNNDMRVEPDFLAPLLAPFENDDVFAVASQIFFPPGLKGEETGLTRARFNGGAFDYSHDPVPADPPPAIPILWGSGGACAFDKRKWEALGGLDVMFDPFYFEDLDLSLRAWRRGWKVLLAPYSKVWHEHRATSRRFFGEDFVNEMFRRNSYLLQWADLHDPALLASHLLHLPLLAARDARKHSLSGAKSFARAVLKA